MESIKKRLLAKAFNRGSWEVPSIPRSFSSSPMKRERSLDRINPFRAIESPMSFERAQPVRAARHSFPLKQVSEDYSVEQVSEDYSMKHLSEDYSRKQVSKNFSVEEVSEKFPEDEVSEESDHEAKIQELPTKKPVAFLILEDYIREVCVEIEKNSHVCRDTLLRAKKIIHALNDCTKEIPNLSIYFYNLARCILRELSTMKENDDYQSVLHKLLELAAFISEKRYESKEQPVSKYSMYVDKTNDISAKSALEKRMKNLNPRNINLIGKIIADDLELKKVVKAYLILLEELDPLILQACRGLDSVCAMRKLSQTPNRVYRITQTTLAKFDSDEISIEAMKRMKEILDTISLRRLKQKERSGVGVILYEFLTYCAKFACNEPIENEVKKTPVNKRIRSLKTTEDRTPTTKQMVINVVARRSSTPKDKPKVNGPSFNDPLKQKLLDAIVNQQRMNTKFRQFLKEYIKTNKISLKDRSTIVDAFANEMNVKTKECERFKVPNVFKEHLKVVKNNKGN